MSWPEYQHRAVLTKLYAGTDAYLQKRGARIKADASLHYLKGNVLPYFSLTGEIFIPNRRDCESCGQLTHDILAHWPELAPIAALHLSDANGIPMHVEANGWYQLAGYYGGAGERYHAGNSECQHWNADGTFDRFGFPTPDECLKVFADRVRVTLDEARALAQEWQAGIPYAEARQHYRLWIAAQAPRWKAEADAGVALLDKLRA